VKEDKYYEYDRKLKKEIKNSEKYNLQMTCREMDMTLSTTVEKENDLERLVDSFTEAMQTACGGGDRGTNLYQCRRRIY